MILTYAISQLLHTYWQDTLHILIFSETQTLPIILPCGVGKGINLSKNILIILIAGAFVFGIGTAFALNQITLAGDVRVNGNTVLDGELFVDGDQLNFGRFVAGSTTFDKSFNRIGDGVPAAGEDMTSMGDLYIGEDLEVADDLWLVGGFHCSECISRNHIMENELTTNEIKNGTINSSDIENGSIEKEDIKGGDVPKLLAVSEEFVVWANSANLQRTEEISTVKNNSVCFLSRVFFDTDNNDDHTCDLDFDPGSGNWTLTAQGEGVFYMECGAVCLSWN